MRLPVTVNSEIKKPINTVFEAVCKASKMTRYFISESSGDIEAGKTLDWTFSDVGENGITFPVKIETVLQNEFIEFFWGPAGNELRVNIKFEAIDNYKSRISIQEFDFGLTEEGIKSMMGQTQGWTDFICCLKAYLYTGVNLRTGQMNPKD